ncbi:tyrosine-type recombinase/integrase [Sphaerisporangium sp. TRM90804]|uniref:tyrosine-type recombinase/integrase n=1 Tax=Sphaerisporangium sp. TRM90804 TaxID=3031113 RepID=UPI00244A7758|nr:tyrosine-type recombinase/integrase [Sphaerisporangium sp. TRM90804]MDH2428448.1 tyrosine-type recombinase/integrase [Sphaerisporangium sp. TRM90804]
MDALKILKAAQDDERELVFSTGSGMPLSAHNTRRDFRKVLDDAGLTGKERPPRELRRSFVSPLPDHDIPLEDISRLVGHSNTVVTETVYRHQIRPVIQDGATAMDAHVCSGCGGWRERRGPGRRGCWARSHFAAMEAPDLLVEVIRAFFRPLR